MRKYLLRYLPRSLILVTALICWYHALILSADMARSASSVSFRYGTGGIPCPTVDRIMDEEGVPFAVWRQENDQSVKELDFSRETTVHVLEIAGDPELVLPAEELLYGFLPIRGSTDTCAIDSATAYALWGGTDVNGETLIYSEREYTVTGIFAQPKNTLLIQSGLNENTVFPYLELFVSATAAPRQQADEFFVRYSLPKPDILIDHAESAAMQRQLALLPALLAVALLLWRVLRLIFVNPVSSLRRVGFITAMVAGVLLSAWAIELSPVIPAVAIPGRWSDFSFWTRLMETAGESANLSREFSWPVPDILWWHRERSLLLYSSGAIIGCLIGILRKS